MSPSKKAYREVAKQLATEIDARHPPYANSRREIQYTRKPTGAWVNMWVWVPQEMAILEQTRGK